MDCNNCNDCAKCFGKTIKNIINIDDQTGKRKRTIEERVEELEKMFEGLNTRHNKLRYAFRNFEVDTSKEITILKTTNRLLTDRLEKLDNRLEDLKRKVT